MKKETYKVCKVFTEGHQWVTTIVGQETLRDYISDVVHEKEVTALLITFEGMKDPEGINGEVR